MIGTNGLGRIYQIHFGDSRSGRKEGESDEKRDRSMVETWKDGCQFDLSLSRLSVSSFPESGFVFCGQRAAAECADCSRPSGGHASRVADTFWDTLYDFRTQIC